MKLMLAKLGIIAIPANSSALRIPEAVLIPVPLNPTITVFMDSKTKKNFSRRYIE
jgi:hypothetical protein